MKLFAWVIALELLGIALVLVLLGNGKMQRELSEEIPHLMGTMEPSMPGAVRKRLRSQPRLLIFRGCEKQRSNPSRPAAPRFRPAPTGICIMRMG
jgi:hypothetical protein